MNILPPPCLRLPYGTYISGFLARNLFHLPARCNVGTRTNSGGFRCCQSHSQATKPRYQWTLSMTIAKRPHLAFRTICQVPHFALLWGPRSPPQLRPTPHHFSDRMSYPDRLPQPQIEDICTKQATDLEKHLMSTSCIHLNRFAPILSVQ